MGCWKRIWVWFPAIKFGTQFLEGDGNLDAKMYALSIQLCPKKGINPTILLWGWDWDHQTYSREGYGCLGMVILMFVFSEKKKKREWSFGWCHISWPSPHPRSIRGKRVDKVWIFNVGSLGTLRPCGKKLISLGVTVIHKIEESDIVDLYFISSKFTLDTLQR